MKMIIDFDGDLEDALSYLKALNIDSRFINSVKFEKR